MMFKYFRKKVLISFVPYIILYNLTHIPSLCVTSTINSIAPEMRGRQINGLQVMNFMTFGV